MSRLVHFTSDDISNFDRFYRANLVNSVTGYKPVNLVGTYSEDSVANLAIFTSAVHLGADPPLIGLVQRPVGEYSHTYKNISRTQFYTINHVHEAFIENAHLTSAKYPADESEFKACRLTEEKLPAFAAPFVRESMIKLGMKLIREIPITENNTLFLIGEILHLFVMEEALLEDGNVNLEVVNDVCATGLYTYNKVTRIQTFPYAKKK